MRTLAPAISRADLIAILAVTAYCIAALVLGSALGMSWSPATWRLSIVPVLFLVIAAYYLAARPSEQRLGQITLYAGLWSALPLAGTQMTFIANAAGMPLQDDLFTAMDKAIGFEWKSWAEFVLSRPWLHWLTNTAYKSYVYQPFIAVVVLALFGPPRRNANFILAMAIALTITIAISTLIPAIEPGRAFGFETPAADAMLAVRAGQWTDLPYIGILCFPSFHAAMAILFAAAYRGIRYACLPMCAANLIMLLSVPFSGDHYLVDVIAGVAVALIAQWIANGITANHSELAIYPPRSAKVTPP